MLFEFDEVEVPEIIIEVIDEIVVSEVLLCIDDDEVEVVAQVNEIIDEADELDI